MQDNHKSTGKFPFSYLPAPVASSFRDALGCYRHGLMHAYSTMCRLTMQAAIADLGESYRLKIFDQVEEIAELAEIDDRVYRNIRSILFETDTSNLYQPNGIDREAAAVMLETMKDVLYQAYVRRELLRQKLKMRRFFATQEDTIDIDDPKVAPIGRKGAA